MKYFVYLVVVTLFLSVQPLHGQIIESFAGTDQQPEGLPASDQYFEDIDNIRMAPNGDFYFTSDGRIYGVNNMNNTVYPVAGFGNSEFVEGIIAYDLPPFFSSIEFDQDGNLYTSDYVLEGEIERRKILRINLDTNETFSVVGYSESGESIIAEGSFNIDVNGEFYFMVGQTIYKIDKQTNIVNEVFHVDDLPQTEYDKELQPGLEFDSQNNIYIQTDEYEDPFVFLYTSRFWRINLQSGETEEIVSYYLDGEVSLTSFRVRYGYLYIVTSYEVFTIELISNPNGPVVPIQCWSIEGTDLADIEVTEAGKVYLAYNLGTSAIAISDVKGNYLGRIGNVAPWWGDRIDRLDAGVLPNSLASNGSKIYLLESDDHTFFIYSGIRSIDLGSSLVENVISYDLCPSIEGPILATKSGNLIFYGGNTINKLDILSNEVEPIISGGDEWSDENGLSVYFVFQGREGVKPSLAIAPDGKLYVYGRLQTQKTGIFLVDPEAKVIETIYAGYAIDWDSNNRHMEVDDEGYIWFNNNNYIWKLQPTEHQEPIKMVGNGTSGYGGEGTDALQTSIFSVKDLSFDMYGNLVFIEGERIRRITARTGTIATIAGSTEDGFEGDGGNPIDAKFYRPSGLVFDQEGNLYVADMGNRRIRVIRGLEPEDPVYAIRNFTLVNAASNTEVTSLADGDMVNLFDFDGKINIKATTHPEQVGSVLFKINGANFRTENAAPYALAGDISGNYNVWDVKPGIYSICATPFSEANRDGDQGAEYCITITIKDEEASQITGLTLVNAETNADIRELEASNTIDIAVDGDRLNVRANTLAQLGSVVFTIDGNKFRTENVIPFALAGDISGDYMEWEIMVPGDKEVCAIPYSGPKGTGDQGLPVCTNITFIDSGGSANHPPEITVPPTEPLNFWGEEITLQVTATDQDQDKLSFSASGLPPSLSIDPNTGLISGVLELENSFGSSTGFTATIEVSDGVVSDSDNMEFFILHPGVESFSLIDTDTDMPVPGFDPLSDGAMLNLNSLPENLSVRANTSIVEINGGAVIFRINGSYVRAENVAPYALGGDNPPGDYDPFNFEQGEYNLSAGIYSGVNGGGGFSFNGDLFINVTVVNGLVSTINSDIQNEVVGSFETSVYPNPFIDKLNLSIPIMDVEYVRWTLTDLRGRLVLVEEARSGGVTEIDVSELPEGVYILAIDAADEKHTFRVVK